jgi:hypothetical protein
MEAKGTRVLRNNVLSKRPGMTIYGVGDKKHQEQVSGHNPDDTPGVRAEDQDSDNIAEWRALDFMVGTNFSPSDAQKLYNDLSSDPENQQRLLYVIHNGKIRSASTGWTERRYTGKDQHTKHVHASGEADADSNEAPWNLSDWGDGSAPPPLPDEELVVDGVLGSKTIAKWQKVMGTTVDGVIDQDDSELVRAVQRRLKETVDHRLVVDGQGIYQNGKPYKTVGALQRYLKSPVDQVLSVPVSQCIKALQRRLNEDRF